MYNIHRAMKELIKFASKTDKAKYITGKLRSMKRLWPNVKGLKDRRD